MKSFINNAAQGEISIRKIEVMPNGVKSVEAKNGVFVIGYSETGHHHVMTMDRTQVFEEIDAPAGMRVLYAILDAPNTLVHQRNFDTHEPMGFQPGMYEFRSGREFDQYAELARRQAD